ncbi:EamA family transporter, partial [Bacteroides uniformis]
MQNVSIKGFIYAALSSATFGLAPFFTISLLLAGFSSFEVLAYRWGIASLALVVFGIMLGETFRISRKDWGTVF